MSSLVKNKMSGNDEGQYIELFYEGVGSHCCTGEQDLADNVIVNENIDGKVDVNAKTLFSFSIFLNSKRSLYYFKGRDFGGMKIQEKTAKFSSHQILKKPSPR